MWDTMSEIEQLERILNSAQLASSPSLSRFLRYIVEETLAGRSQEIREYTLGVHVFDRGQDFNPRLDPIVRVQARNLRARMAKYYEGTGADDPIVIDLPKGTYVPLFHKRVAQPDFEPATRSLPDDAPEASPFRASIMPVPPPRSPVAKPRVQRYWIAAVILLAILIGMAAFYLSSAPSAHRAALAGTNTHVLLAWGILGG